MTFFRTFTGGDYIGFLSYEAQCFRRPLHLSSMQVQEREICNYDSRASDGAGV